MFKADFGSTGSSGGRLDTCYVEIDVDFILF